MSEQEVVTKWKWFIVASKIIVDGLQGVGFKQLGSRTGWCTMHVLVDLS